MEECYFKWCNTKLMQDKYFFTKQCRVQRCKSRLKREKNQTSINLKTNKYWNQVSIFFAFLKKLKFLARQEPKVLDFVLFKKDSIYSLLCFFCWYYSIFWKNNMREIDFIFHLILYHNKEFKAVDVWTVGHILKILRIRE